MDYITTPHQAELNAAEQMKLWGYLDAVATTGGADGGIDVRSSRALAQVKWKGGVAGRPDMQKLFGSRGTDTSKDLLFFAASGYSPQAVDYANQVAMGLYTYNPLGVVEPVNPAAQQIMGKKKPVITRWAIGKNEWLVIGYVLAVLVAIGFTLLQVYVGSY